MNLWIEIARDSLARAIAAVDLVLMNDAELRMLTEQPNLVRAAREVMAIGPRMVVAKQGEYGAALFTRRQLLRAAGLPARGGASTRPARATASPAASSATSTRIADEELSDQMLRRAMTYGSVMASFNVEQFGTERVQPSPTARSTAASRSSGR